MMDKYPIEIKAFDNIPMMIETKRLNYWDKSHCENLAYILERTIDGKWYRGKKTCKEDEFPFQTYILAKRDYLYDLVRLDFKPADIACCEEILKIHRKEVRKYGLYGEKKK